MSVISSLRRTRRLILATFLALSLIASACGDDDETPDAAATDDTIEATDSEATEEPADGEAAEEPADGEAAEEPADGEETEEPAEEAGEPTGSPIVIAALLDVTGLAAPTPYTVELLNAWADQVNSNGGLGGHPVQVEIEDTKGDSAGALAQLDSLLAKDPQAIFVVATGVEAALAAPLAESGIPVIGSGFTPALWGGSIEAFALPCSTEEGAQLPCAPPNAFPLTTTFGAVVDMQLVNASLVGAGTVVQAACAEVEACSQSAPIFQATAATLGLEVAPLTLISASAPDYSAECVSFIQEGVELIQMGVGLATAVNIANDCLDQGYDGWFGASAGVAGGELLDVEGIRLAGTLNAFPWFADDPAVQEFRDVMEAGGLTEAQYGTSAYTGSWTALKLLEKAFENAGITADQDVTADDVLAAMYTISDETLGGLTHPVTFTEGEPAASRDCFWPFTLVDGVIETVNEGLEFSCYPAES
jgi:branched-chain amino acid transport system substrate-binding protein